MDPDTVVASARGDVDEALLTGTRGGLLGRDILAEAPLIAHLRDDETLHYLLSGPATPTRVTAEGDEPVDARGSYLTLVAVTDDRLLVVVGSEDGDRRFSFPYGDLVDVDLEAGLLTGTVVVEAGPDRTWRIDVGRGSDAADAVAYARERLSGSDAGGSPEVGLVDAVFRRLVGAGSDPLHVEQYGPEDLDALVADLDAHHERLRSHLADGEHEAARGAAATVEALGSEGEELAAAGGDSRLARRIAVTRREARRAIVAAAFDLTEDPDRGNALDRALELVHRAVDPDDFGRLVADFWEALGYRTTVTPSTRDSGMDVVARRSTPDEETVVIEARHDAPDRVVDEEAVEQSVGLYDSEPRADDVVVVSSGEFTDSAVEAATELDVTLVDGDRLVELVGEHDLHDVVARHAV